MGASEVEVVGNVKNASRKDLNTYDYVVTKDTEDRVLSKLKTTVVSMEWIKQCLISGRLLRKPRKSK